ncbi:hypothetical protein ABT56_20465 [Photobacterium aquae]|uniref:LysM domain-containing protein n=2 Tax=Photobacterium aquae TaxID=1195763 RepID=A0A0J1GU48_9GAMM|nr:hypothetical protein ABT56_20465 [Photobacterium aquae]
MGGWAWAKAPQLNVIDGAPSVYTVKKGDTLWDISGHFLENPWLWPELWKVNDYIKNPHLIYPGDKIYLVWVDGKPQLQLKRTMKLSPTVKVVRAPVTTLRSSLLLPYLNQDKLVTPAALDRLPRVLGSSEAKGYMSAGDTLWVDQALTAGETWWVYRPDVTFEREVAEGEMPKVLAMKEVARAKVVSNNGEKSRLELEMFLREVKQNDVLLPAPLPAERLAMSFSPSRPEPTLSAKVLGLLGGGMKYMATNDVVVMDIGHLDSAAAGNVFTVYPEDVEVIERGGEYTYEIPSYIRDDEKVSLEAMPIGEVMVIRAYEHFSLAVVTKATAPLPAGAKALPPVYE